MRPSHDVRPSRRAPIATILIAFALLPAARARAYLFATAYLATPGVSGVAHFDDAGHYLGLLPTTYEGGAGLDVDNAGRVYVVRCFATDLAGGPPHAIGKHMYKFFTVG